MDSLQAVADLRAEAVVETSLEELKQNSKTLCKEKLFIYLREGVNLDYNRTAYITYLRMLYDKGDSIDFPSKDSTPQMTSSNVCRTLDYSSSVKIDEDFIFPLLKYDSEFIGTHCGIVSKVKLPNNHKYRIGKSVTVDTTDAVAYEVDIEYCSKENRMCDISVSKLDEVDIDKKVEDEGGSKISAPESKLEGSEEAKPLMPANTAAKEVTAGMSLGATSDETS